MDTTYILRFADDIVFIGEQSNVIKYFEIENLWKVLSTYGEVMAKSNATKQTLLLGIQTWKMFNDSEECQWIYGNPYSKKMNLNACKDDQFNCDDGSCIDILEICDGKINCYDTSDENQCTLIKKESTYTRQISPQNNSTKKDSIDISIDLLNIYKINEVEGTIWIKINITATWFDYRLEFFNLQRKTNLE